MLWPEPTVTSTTPENESAAAIQNREPNCSIPAARAIRAVKIGSVPKKRDGGRRRQVEREDEAELVSEARRWRARRWAGQRSTRRTRSRGRTIARKTSAASE